MIGAGIFLIALDPKLGGASLIPALAIVIIITQLISRVGEAKECSQHARARRHERRNPGRTFEF